MSAAPFPTQDGILRPPAELDTLAAAAAWEPTMAAARAGNTIDASGVTKLDSAGAVLLLEAAAAATQGSLREPSDPPPWPACAPPWKPRPPPPRYRAPPS